MTFRGRVFLLGFAVSILTWGGIMAAVLSAFS
ncbi:hypothetical protein ABID21_000701 [Pseudorhizobium tarimense]|uniref:EamA family transporter n=1 Tax=Pseudorhizobium tarimense TaxID=1079109 RepID=A0ABV2H247_9HYPH